jgi:SagB-type dehydrogenase family enzyme
MILEIRMGNAVASSQIIATAASDVSATRTRPDLLTVVHVGGQLRLKGLDPLTCDTLLAVFAAAREEPTVAGAGRDLTAVLLDPAQRTATARLRLELARLFARRLIVFHVLLDDRAIMRIAGRGQTAHIDWGASLGQGEYRMAEYSILRHRDGRLQLESYGNQLRIEIDPLAVLPVLEYSSAACGNSAPAAAPPSGDTRRQIARMLLACGVLELVGAGPSDSSAAPVATQNFHDVIFHANSRYGLTDSGVGATYRLAEVMAPPAALYPDAGRRARLQLETPQHEASVLATSRLADVMGTRKSVRTFGKRPITRSEVSAFLFQLGCRNGSVVRRTIGPHSYEVAPRFYPNAGAAYELEIYLVVRDCAGIEAGMFRYVPESHELEYIDADPSEWRRLLAAAQISCGSDTQPQVLVILSSRFARLSWKYDAIAYSLTLKNVGVMFAYMYLIGTALGLATCALGCGDSAVFAQATGLDPLEESSVGEFIIGSMDGSADE